MTKLTKEVIITVLRRRDAVGTEAIGRALVHLYNRQTAYEQQAETTVVKNNVGFTAGDGKRGVGMAKYFMRHGKLTPGQVSYWQGCDYGRLKRARIEKYWAQILDEAVQKQS